VIFNASAAMRGAEGEEGEGKTKMSLRDAAAQVRLAGRATTKWHRIVAEGIGLGALARDEASHIMDTIMDTPFDVRRRGWGQGRVWQPAVWVPCAGH